jgi:hypothetical protein
MFRRFTVALCLGLAPALALAADPESVDNRFEVPYKLTDTQHVLVRAKINGKGPFNLILDTGAPAVFITKPLAKKTGVEIDGKGWGRLDQFEIEGGLSVPNVKTRVEDLVQLDGMNSMGLAGVELHGVIGYNVLAQFRIVYDFTADKLAFEPIPGFEPPAPGTHRGQGRRRHSGHGTDDQDARGALGHQAELRDRPARLRRN